VATIDEFEILNRTGGSLTAVVAARAHNLLSLRMDEAEVDEINDSEE